MYIRMDLEPNKDLYFICECGKKILKKNRNRHLKSSVKHDYYRLRKAELDRLGDWTSESFEVENPLHENE